MNALLTGGAGFIGSHLADQLLEKGYTVFAMDNLATGNFENIKHLIGNDKFIFVHGSVLDKYLTERYVRECDVIYHLAAAVGVKYIMENLLIAIQCNVHGTEIVLELASKWKRKVLIASTSEVYGKDENVPYKEEGDRLIGPTTTSRWSYACTKALDEFMALAYNKEQKVPVVITRFFNICGPRQTGRYGMVVPRFVRNALLGKTLEVYGDGTQSRCFAYVGDAVRAVITLMETENAVGEIFNVGSTQEISIRDLAQKVIDMTNSESNIEYVPYENVYGDGFEDMKRRIPDISKIRNFIGWEPKVYLDELLQMIIDHEKHAITDIEQL
jgi:UDP-glucose 4-epimerase